MANELAVVNDNWLELADSGKPLPRPFEREILALRGFVKKDIGVLSQSKSPGLIAI